MIDNEAQYNYLLASTGATEITIGGKIQAPINCPYCPTYSDEKNPRATFGNIMTNGAYGGWGFHCFVCDSSASLFELGYLLDVGVVHKNDSEHTNTRTSPIKQQVNYTWMYDADRLAQEYASNPGRYDAWDKYKCITPDAVDRWQLGLGVLPETRKFSQQRLITPIHGRDGHVVWLRGRLPAGQEGTKWVGAGGVSPTSIDLAMADMIKEGFPLVVCENYVDALAINHYLGHKYSAVPTFSVSYWSSAWVEEIVRRGPSQVLVAFDPDLAGNGPVSVQHAKDLFSSRIAKITETPVEAVKLLKWNKGKTGWKVTYELPQGEGVLNLPRPFGLQRAEHLIEAGVPASVAKWTNPRYDIGDFLSHELRRLKESK